MTRQLWEQEYVNKSISSSTNDAPSHGTEFLRQCLPRIAEVAGPRRMLDLGCGGGRNVTMLRETGLDYYGLDFAHRPLLAARARNGADLPLVQASIADPLPFRSGSFSLVTAFTAIENIPADEQLRQLGEQVQRVLCQGGMFYVYFLTTDDSYYRPLVRVDDGRSLTYDPVTELRQRVYRVEELADLFAPSLQLETSERFVFEDTRSQGRYERTLAAGLWCAS